MSYHILFKSKGRLIVSKLVTAKEMKALDQYTIKTIGIPSLVLMERASLAVRDYILAHDFDLSRVVVVAGFGNNGGDGLCIARLLKIAGAQDVSVISIGNPTHASSEHQVQAHICDYYEISLTQTADALASATLIIDAIFGIGIDRPVEGDYATMIEAINAATAPKVAVDIPSGIHADTGEVLGHAVNADATVTFAYNKFGLTKADGPNYAGKVIVANDMGTYEHA